MNKSVKERMEKYLNGIAKNTTYINESENIVLGALKSNDINTIQNNLKHNMKKGRNAIFLSSTKRDSPSSNIPGPGDYNIKYDHHVYKCKFDSFGSTTDRDIAFNRSIQLPFTDPSYLLNPPVGYYYKQLHKSKDNSKAFSPLQNQGARFESEKWAPK